MMEVFAPVFCARNVSPLVEQVAGAAMARVEFARGHRRAHPETPKGGAEDAGVQCRRQRVRKMRLGGASVAEIAERLGAGQQTVKHDLQVLRQRGEIPENMPRKVA